MPRVTLATNTVGSDIVTAATTIFHFESGETELSTDTGTTYIRFTQGMYLTVSSGLTVKNRNTRSDTSTFSYMAI
jgi:hypothetical protein